MVIYIWGRDIGGGQIAGFSPTLDDLDYPNRLMHATEGEGGNEVRTGGNEWRDTWSTC